MSVAEILQNVRFVVDADGKWKQEGRAAGLLALEGVANPIERLGGR
jgi:hypothetical protein